jgi:hypothetical protein
LSAGEGAGRDGLKLREALGVVRGMEEKVERVVEEKMEDLETKVEETKVEVEEKAKERVV